MTAFILFSPARHHSQTLPRTSFSRSRILRPRSGPNLRPSVRVFSCAEHTVPATSTSAPPVRTRKKSPRAAPPKLDRVVCKFGGSSLADSARLREVGKLVKMQAEACEKSPVVVLSAMGKTTNELLEAGRRALEEGVVDMTSVRSRVYEACDSLGLDRESLVDSLLLNLDQLLLGVKFIREISPRTMDYLVSFGERLSVRIFAAHLTKNEGLEAVAVDSYDMGFRTTSSFTKAELLDETYSSVKDYFEKRVGNNVIAVVTGFIAKDSSGNMTTLGRGGSDLTASAIGASIGVSEVQVWKDVDGILTTDPRIVRGAMPVPSLMFEEAAEMAYFGAKILHPTSMQPAMRLNIPVRVKNSYNPQHPGTVIVGSRKTDRSNPVTAISLKKKAQLVDIVSTRMLGSYGFMAEVFKIFAKYKVSVDVIATSEVSVSMTLDETNCEGTVQEGLRSELEGIATVRFVSGKAIVSLVSSVSRSTEVLGRAMNVLQANDIDVQMISQGASKFNISLIVEGTQAPKTVSLLHEEFFGR